MSVKNGIYRIAQLTKWTSRLLGGLLLLVNTYSLIAERNHLGRNLPAGFELETNHDAFAVLLVIVVCMAMAEGVAWILEGFIDE